MKRPRSWRRALLVLLAGGLFITTMFRWFEHNQVYHPTRNLEATGAALARPFQNVWFKASDGVELNGWFFPAATNSPRARWAIALCHGNGGNISHRLETCQALLDAGVGVLLFDYRGYGQSHGRPSEQGTYLDAQAAYDWLGNQGFEPTKIVAYGESLGGGVAAELALRNKTGGLILQSTFTSIPDIGAELFPWLPVRLLARIRYDTLQKLPRIHVPVLVMHSRADELIPWSHGQKNFVAANQPKFFCELMGGHNDPLAERERFVSGLDQFFRSLDQTQH